MSKHPLKLGSRLLLAVASFAVLAACGPAEAPAPAEPTPVARAFDDAAWPTAAVADPTTTGFTVEGLKALDDRMAKSVADGDVAGMVYILGKGGEIAAFNAHGIQSGDPKTGTPITKDTLFRIYSMTKPITGVAMMQLFEQGKWAMEDPISKHVPELAGLKVLTWKDGKPVMGADGKPVLAAASAEPTMRQLMSHTAGFGYGLAGDDPVNNAFRDSGVLVSKDLEEMIGKIKDIPLIYDPGSRWYYSVAVDIQGYIVQKLSGQKFGEYLKQHIFTPLGMNDTAFYVSEANAPRFADVYSWPKDATALAMLPERPDRPSFLDPNRMESGGGGLVGSTHDYARFAQMFLNKGTLGGNTVLKPETVELMRTNTIGELRLYSDGTTANPGLPGVGFGMDFAVYDDTSVTGQPYGKGTHYWGGAAGTWFWIDPANDLFFVGMIQQMGGFRPGAMNFRNESAQLVYGALATATPAAPADAAPATTPNP